MLEVLTLDTNLSLLSESCFKLVVNRENELKRLDLYLSEKIPQFSRSFLVKLINAGYVLVNGKQVDKSFNLRVGDSVSASLDGFYIEDRGNIVAQNIPLDIIYEDDYLIVVNKKKGMVTHPAPGHYKDTLVNALKFHTSRLSNLNSDIRPGIVHRLDKDTSGVILVAKDNFAHENLAEQIKNKTAKREYLGIIHGKFKYPNGKIDFPIGRDKKNRKKMSVTDKNSKNAVTNYVVLKSFKRYSYIRFSLETGRTHQIRVHCSKLGHPLAGDILYGARGDPDFLFGQCLHAFKITFNHPKTHDKLEFSADLPDYFKKFLYIISNE